MRRKVGITFLILGVLLITASAALLAYNTQESAEAGEAAQRLMTVLHEEIPDEEDVEESGESSFAPSSDDDDSTMNTVEIDGYLYIGYISFPTLGLELPVMEDWDYTRMKLAPCRYYGSYKTDDMVIAGHNYTDHFGRLSSLSLGDAVIFTDADGQTHSYEVAAIEELGAYDVPEMTESGYALTLFTCNYSGQRRITVRCTAAEG